MGLALLLTSLFAPGVWGLLPDLAGFACLFCSVRMQLRDARPPSATAAAGIDAAWVEPAHAAWWSSRGATKQRGGAPRAANRLAGAGVS